MQHSFTTSAHDVGDSFARRRIYARAVAITVSSLTGDWSLAMFYIMKAADEDFLVDAGIDDKATNVITPICSWREGQTPLMVSYRG